MQSSAELGVVGGQFDEGPGVRLDLLPVICYSCLGDGACPGVETVETLGNQIEGVFWIVIAAAVLVAGIRAGGRMRTLAVVAAVLFVLFGVSDFIEATTGAWWRPWWLLVWKGLCLLGLLACLPAYKRLHRA